MTTSRDKKDIVRIVGAQEGTKSPRVETNPQGNVTRVEGQRIEYNGYNRVSRIGGKSVHRGAISGDIVRVGRGTGGAASESQVYGVNDITRGD